MRTIALDRMWTRFAAGVLGGLLAAAMAAPMMANAQTEQTAEVGMQDEAWYYRDRQPLTDVPDEAPVEDPSGQGLDTVPGIGKAVVRDATGDLSPGEYVRTSINLGRVDGIAFVTFPLTELGEGFDVIVTGGTVTLTSAPRADENARQRNVDLADMVACLTEEFVVASDPGGGDWEDLPAFDCDVSSPLELVEDRDEVDPPQWTVDLEPFVPAWEDPLNNFGITIVPNPEVEGTGGTFHVAFPNQHNDVEGAEPPRAELTYVEQDLDLGFDMGDNGGFETDDTGFQPAPQPQQQTFGNGGFEQQQTFDNGGFDAGAPPMTADEPAGDDFADDPEVAEDDAAPAPQRQPTEPTAITTNPAIALIPLLGLGLAGLLGYSLSKDPELPVERKGAVSKLMERRGVPGS